MTTASSSTLLDSLSALNGSARLRILRLVSKHELSVGEVAYPPTATIDCLKTSETTT